MNNIIYKHNIKSYNNNNVTYYVFEYDGLGNLGGSLNYEDNGNDLFTVSFGNESSELAIPIYVKTDDWLTKQNIKEAKQKVNEINTSNKKNHYNIFKLEYNQNILNKQILHSYKQYEFMRLSFIPNKYEYKKHNIYIPFININKILDNIFYDIYSFTLTELSKNNNIYISQLVNNVNRCTLDDKVEIYNTTNNKNVISIKGQDDSITYITELLCNNMGNLLYSPDDDKEIYNKQNICLYDKIKFVFYKANNNYYIEITGNKAPIFDTIVIS
jgi:hypothetical protein